MSQSIGARRLNIRGKTKDRARFTALADDRQLTAADLYRRMLFGRAPKRGMKHTVDIAAGASSEILKSIGAAVIIASEANKKFVARRQA